MHTCIHACMLKYIHDSTHTYMHTYNQCSPKAKMQVSKPCHLLRGTVSVRDMGNDI